MTEVSDFLIARITEDEAAARAAFQLVGDRQTGGWYWSGAGDAVFLDDTSDPVACGPWQQAMHRPSADHVVRWDPERVVAECVAKRRVVEGCAAALEAPSLLRGLWARIVHRRRREFARATLRLLALPYGGHPGYRQGRRP